MNFIYFIYFENPQLAKYCEGFYNHLTYGYKYYNVIGMFRQLQLTRKHNQDY